MHESHYFTVYSDSTWLLHMGPLIIICTIVTYILSYQYQLSAVGTSIIIILLANIYLESSRCGRWFSTWCLF